MLAFWRLLFFLSSALSSGSEKPFKIAAVWGYAIVLIWYWKDNIDEQAEVLAKDWMGKNAFARILKANAGLFRRSLKKH